MMIPRDITNNNTTTTTTTDGVVPVVVAAVAAAINDDSVIDNDDNDNDDDSDDRDNNNNAPAAIVRREERLLTLLDSTKAPPSFVDQQDYENRLLTYRAMTYYAKPSCLSPLFCARFGYVRYSKVILVVLCCCSCCFVRWIGFFSLLDGCVEKSLLHDSWVILAHVHGKKREVW